MLCGNCIHNGHCELRPDQIRIEPSVTVGNFGEFGRSPELLGDDDHDVVYNHDHMEDNGAETVSGIPSMEVRTFRH